MEAVSIECATASGQHVVITVDISKLPARDVRCIERVLTKSRIKVTTPESLNLVGIPFVIQLLRETGGANVRTR